MPSHEVETDKDVAFVPIASSVLESNLIRRIEAGIFFRISRWRPDASIKYCTVWPVGLVSWYRGARSRATKDSQTGKLAIRNWRLAFPCMPHAVCCYTSRKLGKSTRSTESNEASKPRRTHWG